MMKKIVSVVIAFVFVLSCFGQVIDRSKKPKAGPPPVIKLADPVIYKLSNGLTILVVENHKLPVVRASFRVDAGPVTEGIKAGTVGMMGEMLYEGTTARSKAEFDEAVDLLGANVGFSWTGGNVSSLTRYFEKAFGLMTEALRNPAFPQESFDKLVSQHLTALKTVERSASSISDRVVSALAFGPNHPEGEFETEASIRSITLEDIKQAYGKYITPARAYLIFVGDVKPADAKALAQKAFGDWKGYSLTLEKVPQISNPVNTEINLVDVPNAVQSEINVVNLVSIPMSSPDYFPVLLANRILGGGADARLYMNLREKHGFTYGAYSNIAAGRTQTLFNASAAVRNEKADSAVAQFLYEINRMRTTKVSASELQNAKNQYNGGFALGMENPARTAEFAANILIHKLPANFYRTYLQRINAVTVDDIQRVAKKYFNYANTRVVVVGKKDQVLEGLKKLGYPVKFYDKYAAPVEENDNVAGKVDVTPAQVINNYINVIGGKEALDKITSISSTGNMETMGQELPLSSRRMAPNKELIEISMGGQVLLKSMFDGSTGYQLQMGQKSNLTEDELNEKKAVKGLFEQLYYTGTDHKLEMKGIEKAGDGNAYVVLISLPGGKTRTEYYDVKTGFLVKSSEVIKQGGTDISQVMEYSDYKKVGDVYLAHKINMVVGTPMGSQEMLMNIAETKLNEGVSTEDFK